ncbi:class I SAM-dependent methyltransferase [Streptomyces sp. N2A]|uniref:class I SAM-dependent methyltransferase n=1 Tax=Streptomyces sp. N2A TaxID=3073936 RepID=UPI002870B0ED|nr:class I SAM-dependent methyltransferase [Streptomyces sp. N2A]
MAQQQPRTGPAGAAGHPDGPAAAPDLPPRVVTVYGESDLATVPAFAGGFINFGYWAELGDLTGRLLTEADRVRSEQDLYRLVLGTFGEARGRGALEAGCGRGLGCALALREFGLDPVIGLDAHPDQIARARAAHAELLAGGAGGAGRLTFVLGAAQRMPLAADTVDCLYSVEAVQHFRFPAAFAREAARVLRPGGRLALTTFFARTPQAARELPGLLPPYADGLDVPHVIDEFAGTLAAAGLRDVVVRPIGDAVWEGYDRYMAQQPELSDGWPRRYLTAYETGLLDYYLLTAVAPRRAGG